MIRAVHDRLKPLYEHINKYGGIERIDEVADVAKKQAFKLEQQEKIEQGKRQSRGMRL